MALLIKMSMLVASKALLKNARILEFIWDGRDIYIVHDQHAIDRASNNLTL